LDDLIVGAYYADSAGKADIGKSFVVFGKADTTTVNLSNITSGTGGFVINGENAGDKVVTQFPQQAMSSQLYQRSLRNKHQQLNHPNHRH
jgi:hypothetical protein